MAATRETTGADPFPPFVRELVEADLNIDGLYGWRLPMEGGVLLFMAADRDVTVPEHQHGAQWGVVLSGEMELITEGSERVYRRGDAHFIGAAVPHSAKIRRGWRALYVFLNPGPGEVRADS